MLGKFVSVAGESLARISGESELLWTMCGHSCAPDQKASSSICTVHFYGEMYTSLHLPQSMYPYMSWMN